MAPVSSTEQKRTSHSSQNTPKYPSTLDIRSTSIEQIPTREGTQVVDPHTHFNVRRQRQTWPSLESLAQKVADLNTATYLNPNGHLTPMERWRMETQQQSPWDNIAGVNANSDKQPSQFGEGQKDGSQGGDTDNGTWWP